MKGTKDRIAVYSRKSRFTGKGESIGNQAELCKEYIRSSFGDQYADNITIYEDGPVIIGLNHAKPCDTRGCDGLVLFCSKTHQGDTTNFDKHIALSDFSR